MLIFSNPVPILGYQLLELRSELLFPKVISYQGGSEIKLGSTFPNFPISFHVPGVVSLRCQYVILRYP